MDLSIQSFWQLKIFYKNMMKHDINTIRYNYIHKVHKKLRRMVQNKRRGMLSRGVGDDS